MLLPGDPYDRGYQIVFMCYCISGALKDRRPKVSMGKFITPCTSDLGLLTITRIGRRGKRNRGRRPAYDRFKGQQIDRTLKQLIGNISFTKSMLNERA